MPHPFSTYKLSFAWSNLLQEGCGPCLKEVGVLHPRSHLMTPNSWWGEFLRKDFRILHGINQDSHEIGNDDTATWTVVSFQRGASVTSAERVVLHVSEDDNFTPPTSTPNSHQDVVSEGASKRACSLLPLLESSGLHQIPQQMDLFQQMLEADLQGARSTQRIEEAR
ncbi:hypothetical protein O3P69_009534 [Scylla paramamosain]|uniref:Uncharacterized protein n=1 Tax=Scylla paramamosain TaxID=85552 RepID=A0AAW0SU51_SCYPA